MTVIVPTPLACRFIQEIGTRATHRVYWTGECGTRGYHNGETPIGDSPVPRDWTFAAKPERVVTGELCSFTAPVGRSGEPVAGGLEPSQGSKSMSVDKPMPSKCDECGAPAPDGASKQVFYRRIYDTPTGYPTPGDMYFESCQDVYDEKKCYYWDNCKGKHLIVVTPDNHHWNVDSRARNCTIPEDRIHRCWIAHGEPPNVTVDKNGLTCNAGAGSIQTASWHGFLRNGQLVVN